jgi:hypothetical protein
MVVENMNRLAKITGRRANSRIGGTYGRRLTVVETPFATHLREEIVMQAQSLLVRRAGACAAFAAVTLLGVAAVRAQSAVLGNSGSAGRVEFDYPDLPPATVQVDLSQGLISDVFGIGDAAVAGISEALATSAGTNKGSEGTRLAAEKLTAVRQIVQTLGQVVREVHVRVYEGLPGQSGLSEKLLSHYDEKVRGGNWENVVRAQERDKAVRVAVARGEGAIHGLFVIVADGHDVVLTNFVCDVSPENAKKLTAVAVKTGLEAGLGQVLEAKMLRLNAPATEPSRR